MSRADDILKKIESQVPDGEWVRDMDSLVDVFGENGIENMEKYLDSEDLVFVTADDDERIQALADDTDVTNLEKVSDGSEMVAYGMDLHGTRALLLVGTGPATLVIAQRDSEKELLGD